MPYVCLVQSNFSCSADCLCAISHVLADTGHRKVACWAWEGDLYLQAKHKPFILPSLPQCSMALTSKTLTHSKTKLSHILITIHKICGSPIICFISIRQDFILKTIYWACCLSLLREQTCFLRSPTASICWAGWDLSLASRQWWEMVMWRQYGPWCLLRAAGQSVSTYCTVFVTCVMAPVCCLSFLLSPHTCTHTNTLSSSYLPHS